MLRRVVEQAWTWRDPESIAQVAACLAHLQVSVLHDWRS